MATPDAISNKILPVRPPNQIAKVTMLFLYPGMLIAAMELEIDKTDTAEI